MTNFLTSQYSPNSFIVGGINTICMTVKELEELKTYYIKKQNFLLAQQTREIIKLFNEINTILTDNNIPNH